MGTHAASKVRERPSHEQASLHAVFGRTVHALAFQRQQLFQARGDNIAQGLAANGRSPLLCQHTPASQRTLRRIPAPMSFFQNVRELSCDELALFWVRFANPAYEAPRQFCMT